MKKFYLSASILSVLLAFGVTSTVFGQGECVTSGGCAYNASAEQWPQGVISINSTTFGFATEETYVGDRLVCQVHTGVTYTWSFCSEDGAVAGAGAEDTEFTLFNEQNTLLCYSNNFCGNQPKIEWVSTYTGTVTLQFNAQDCVAVPQVNNTIMMKASEVVSVSEEAISAVVFDVYPNPANDVITINFASRANENVMVQIISSDGRIVHVSNEVSAGGFVANIDLANYSAGMYFVRLTTTSGVLNKKFLVQ